MKAKITALKNAKKVLDYLGGDAQTALAILELAKSVDSDPQRLYAILAIARFLSGR